MNLNVLERRSGEAGTLLKKQFTTDCHGFFSDKKAGNMGSWRYDDGKYDDRAAGAVLWERLVDKATTYYISRLGDQLLSAQAQKIYDVLGGNDFTLIDLGPGKLRNAKIELFESVAKNGTYIPVDISEIFLKPTLDLKRAGIVSDVLPIVADFTSEILNIPTSGRRVFLFLGSTIGNIKAGYNVRPEPQVLAFLQKIKRQMRSGDVMIIGFDSCMDSETVLSCYNDPYSIDVMLAPLHKIERDLECQGSFNPWAFAPHFLWFPDVCQCAHTVIALKDQDISFENRTYSISKGKHLHVSNSYKFDETVMTDILVQTGLSDVAVLKQNRNPMRLALGRVN